LNKLLYGVPLMLALFASACEDRNEIAADTANQDQVAGPPPSEPAPLPPETPPEALPPADTTAPAPDADAPAPQTY
jgi:hypothetical protein